MTTALDDYRVTTHRATKEHYLTGKDFQIQLAMKFTARLFYCYQ
jgi:hypothetical protein